MILLSFGYCDQIYPDWPSPKYLYELEGTFSYHSFIVVTLSRSQSDHIKRIPLYQQYFQKKFQVSTICQVHSLIHPLYVSALVDLIWEIPFKYLFSSINSPSYLSLFSWFFYIFQLWLTLSEKYLSSRGVDWTKAERFCFNEWSNPDDDELGMQIVRVSLI